MGSNSSRINDVTRSARFVTNVWWGECWGGEKCDVTHVDIQMVINRRMQKMEIMQIGWMKIYLDLNRIPFHRIKRTVFFLFILWRSILLHYGIIRKSNLFFKFCPKNHSTLIILIQMILPDSSSFCEMTIIMWLYNNLLSSIYFSINLFLELWGRP